jgi:uncharacterized protein (TIGR03083 family)
MPISEIVLAVGARTDAIVDALGDLGDEDLLAPSHLPNWSRVTIACHLRFGAGALLRMTHGAMAGRPASYYPDGRATQRPMTLVPYPGEHPTDVVRSLGMESNELQSAWRGLEDDDWGRTVTEPETNPDLGPLPLERLPLLRLTEVEVHGSDLDVGLRDWSEVFVQAALPFRVGWLNERRSNHRAVDHAVEGSWLLQSTDGPAYLVSVLGQGVTARRARPGTQARAVIEASSRDLLALLLGRPLLEPPAVSGDVEFAESFSRAFPGP